MSTQQSVFIRRDSRLDFFRGLALLIIFINHIPFNEGQLYTPARFGFSDSAEIFVFCSGFVSARVFGLCFERSGLWLGTLRVLYRCSQIYAAHLGLFILLAVICAVGNMMFEAPDYISRLNIRYFFDETQQALPALATLTYVPHYFDILPMYLVLLAWTPVVWGLGRIRRWLGLACPLGVYAAMGLFDLDLPADPASDRPWFFNPFAWQLLFFAGFAFGSDWVRVRLGQRSWLVACWAVVLLAIPLAHEPTHSRVAWLSAARAALEPWLDKTDFGLLRLAHFLALAYLAVSFVATREALLNRPLPAVIRKTGEHSLSVFLIGMTLAYIGGMVLDQAGHGVWILLAVNVGGCAILLASAYLLDWIGTKPWKNARLATAWSGALVGSGEPMRLADLQRLMVRPLVVGTLLVPLAIGPFLLIQKRPAADSESLQLASLDPAMVAHELAKRNHLAAGIQPNGTRWRQRRYPPDQAPSLGRTVIVESRGLD